MNHTENIDSKEAAHKFAYHWAAERQLDVVKFCEYAKNVFATHGNMPAQMLAASMQHFSIATSNTADYWQSFAIHAWREVSVWAVETVKHLALINTAGLAGTITLLSRTNPTGLCSLRLACVLFIFGLIFALVCFSATTNGYIARGRHAERRASEIRRSASWEQYRDASTHPLPNLEEQRWRLVANLGAWGSVLVCAVAGALLLHAVWN